MCFPVVTPLSVFSLNDAGPDVKRLSFGDK